MKKESEAITREIGDGGRYGRDRRDDRGRPDDRTGVISNGCLKSFAHEKIAPYLYHGVHPVGAYLQNAPKSRTKTQLCQSTSCTNKS